MRSESVFYRLARAHKVPLSNMTAFEGRIKNVQRLGWPSQTKSGRGVPADWSEKNFFDAAIVVELLGVHVNPEAAIEIAKANYEKLFDAARAGQAIELRLPSPFKGAGTESFVTLNFDAVANSWAGPEPTLG